MDNESVMSQVQRRVELQSAEDLAYLVANVRRAAAARLDEALPHVDGAPPDELRSQIEALVHEYIDKTFALAAPNLTVNGLPVASAAAKPSRHHGDDDDDALCEPFDTRKRRRVADLIAIEEKLLEDVAALKRSVPAAAAALRANRLCDALARDHHVVQQRVARVTDPAAADAAAHLHLPPLDRQAHVEASFGAAVEALARLKRDMPAVVAKMERARLAGEYVLTEGR